MAKLIAVVLLGGVLACREPATAPPPFEPVLSDRDLWSGGELQLIEAAFAHADAIVIVGADTLVPQHVDDTTLVVRLPVRSGEFPLRVVAGRVAASLGN